MTYQNLNYEWRKDTTLNLYYSINQYVLQQFFRLTIKKEYNLDP